MTNSPPLAYGALFARHPEGVMVLRAERGCGGAIDDFVFVFLNPQAERFVGRGDLVGLRLLVEMPGNRQAGLFDAYVKAVESGEPFKHELHYQGEGIDRWVRLTATPIDEGLLVSFAEMGAEIRELVDNLPELAWTALPDGYIDFYNRRWYEYTGATPDEMRGWGWQRVHDPELLPRVVERWGRSIETGEAFEMEFPLRGADGVFRWFLTRIRPLCDASGAVVRWFGTNTMIDEQRRLRLAFEAQSQLTRTITDNASMALFLMDDRQRCTFMNPAAEAMTGYTLDEVKALDRPLHELIHHTHPDGRPYPMADCPIDRALPTRAREQGRDVFVHRSGRFYPVAFTASPLLEGGKPVGTVIEVQDRTEQEREERRRELLAKAGKALATSLDQSETLSAVASLFVPEVADYAAVFMRADEGRLELAACRHRDPSLEPVLRATFEQIPPAVLAASNSQRAFDTGASQLGESPDEETLARLLPGEHDWRSRTKRLRARSVMSVPMIAQGSSIGVITLAAVDGRRLSSDQVSLVEEVARQAAVVVDNARLFALAQAERTRADEANRAKDEFLAVVSHELRTPLNAILGWASMLRSGSLAADQTRKASESIERNAKAQAQLIEDLLDYSRIITGKLRLEIEPFEAAHVIEAAVEVVSAAAEAKGVRVAMVLDRHIGPMRGDPARLQQAVWNLLTNAIKFTPRGGRVFVRLERHGSSCVVTVEDTGAGIAPDFLPFVFERFRQADMGSKRKHGGLGLGLAIVRNIVELHGGTIEAQSDGPGRGASFRLALPIAPLRPHDAPPSLSPPRRAAPDPTTTPGAQLVKGLSMLVVDDELDARELVASMLSLCGVEVTTAPSVDDALRRLQERRFDVVLSDIGMPGRDGYDLIKAVRALPPSEGGKTPAIAFTAYAQATDRTRALLAGFDAHVAKPIDGAELLGVIASVAGRHLAG